MSSMRASPTLANPELLCRRKMLNRRAVSGHRHWIHILIAACAAGSPFLHGEETAGAPAPLEIVVSVAEQKLALVKEGAILRKYPISTSKFGLGDSNGSYRPPVGN